MKIKCKKLKATISERTCIARQAKLEKVCVNGVVKGEGINFSLIACAGCKKGMALYEKAAKRGYTYNPHRKNFRLRSMIDVNRDYLKSKFSMAGA